MYNLHISLDFSIYVRYHVHKEMIELTNTNITNFRKNLFEYVDQAVTYGDVVNIATKHGNAVMMSEEDYNGLIETLNLTSIPGMTERLHKAAAEPIEECVKYSPDEEW